MKKKALILVILICLYYTSHGQIVTPVKWSFAERKLSTKEAVIFLKATIDNGWHIYSTMQQHGGPKQTEFILQNSMAYKSIGKVNEPQPLSKFEKAFGMNVKYFEKVVVFQQKVALTSSDAVVSGKINFMACNDQKCLPPEDLEFSIPIK